MTDTFHNKKQLLNVTFNTLSFHMFNQIGIIYTTISSKKFINH